jgi:hypothetical protein
LSGDRRLLNREGTRLTPNGSSLLERHNTSTQNADPEDAPIIGIDILDESNPLSPTIREFASVDATVNCIVSGSDQLTRTERSIVWFTFNEPLNTLYVLTRNSTSFYQFPTGVTPDPNGCVETSVAAQAGTQVVEDSTETLIRVIGPFSDSNVQSSLPPAAVSPPTGR